MTPFETFIFLIEAHDFLLIMYKSNQQGLSFLLWRGGKTNSSVAVPSWYLSCGWSGDAAWGESRAVPAHAHTFLQMRSETWSGHVALTVGTDALGRFLASRCQQGVGSSWRSCHWRRRWQQHHFRIQVNTSVHAAGTARRLVHVKFGRRITFKYQTTETN